MDQNNEKPTFYAIIPARVRYDKTLKPNAKLLYGEITALSSKEGYCFASNRYFSNLYEVNKNTISSWISDLKNKGYISVQIIKEGNEVIERRIGINEIMDTPNHQKPKDINTRINTTVNNSNIEFKRLKFSALVSDESVGILSVDQANEFLSYWSEANKSKTKMRWELERTWDLNARMHRWKRNQQKWDKTIKKPTSLKNKLDTFNKAKQMMDQINNR